MSLVSIHRGKKNSEGGYILLMLMMFAALMIIALTAAAPRLASQIKRDREVEMIHRGEQYARAIKRYYKKFGRYPSGIQDLEKTNNLRFLRKRYKDPMTADGSWRLVRFGEIQLGSQNGGVAGATSVANMGGAMSGQQNPSGGFGQSSGSQGASGTPGTVNGQTGFTTGSGDPSNPQNSGTTGQSSGLFGQQITGGGGAIMGVASTSKAAGIHEFNKKANYKDWLFIYDPQQDKGALIRGPYNPNAFVGQFGSSSIGTPVGQPGGVGGQGQQGQGGFNNGGGSFGQPAGGTPTQNPQPPPNTNPQ